MDKVIAIATLVACISLLWIIGTIMTQTNTETTKTVTSAELRDPTVAKVYDEDVSEPPLSKVIGNDYCEWKCVSADKQGVYTAPNRHIYIIATIQIENNGYSQISTSPSSWKLIADNVSYTPDFSTTRVNQFGVPPEVDHEKHASITVTYLVQGKPQIARLEYVG